ncbi:hypothetical protein AYK24_04785 [Thermoplasmatales archaeon SG8-52-4]|nr:MAG: hypothetical protein AYK24_04785 [Thermoplasmatales archaeon SG8-52-4]
MTDYNGYTTFGQIVCLPDRLVPNIMFKLLLPKLRKREATYALRRLEGKLLDEGFDVTTLRPHEINKIKKIKPKIIGVSTVDPLTKKPHPWTLTNIFGGGESVAEKEFLNLLIKLNRLRKKQDYQIIVGGPGAAEFEKNEKYFDLFDSAVIGAGEGSIELFQKVLNGEKLPRLYHSKNLEIEELSIIHKPARLGHVQLTQGCPRGCQFCAPAELKWISFPKSRILKEINLNLKNGAKSISFITEDILLYGSKDVEVNHKAVIDLIFHINKLKNEYNIDRVNISNVSFPSVIKGKKTCEQITDILGFSNDNPVNVVVGLETGSERLIKKYMEGKPKPYSSDKWYELVKEGTNVLNDNCWYPICNLITGLPDENEEDVIKTIDLVDDLRDNKLFLYVFYFTPLDGSKMENEDFFITANITERRWELFYKCWMHSFKSLKENLNKFINNPLQKFMINKILNEIEKVIKKYKDDVFKMRDTFASVNLKGFNLIKFLARKYLN